MPSDPSKIQDQSSARIRPPVGLLGMIALVVCIEASIMAHDNDFTTLLASSWEVEGQAPAKFASRNQIWCFGDSMVKFGLQPKIVGPQVGKPTYNFALYCGSAASSYYMLKRALDTGSTPEAVVVDFQPELLMCDSISVLSRVYPELLTYRETAELCWKAKNPDRFGEFLVTKTLPSARKRYEIRASLMAALKGDPASIKDKLLAVHRNWKINRGAEVLPKYTYYTGDVPNTGAYPAMFWTPWKPNPLSEQYVRKFLKLAASKKVPVFWVLQPNANEVDIRREASGYNAQYNAYVKACQAKFPNLVVIDGRHVNYPHQLFTDPVHLDRNGATAYSIGVADVLRKHLVEKQTEARWVALPDHRAESNAIALEDHAESIQAIKAEAARTLR